MSGRHAGWLVFIAMTGGLAILLLDLEAQKIPLLPWVLPWFAWRTVMWLAFLPPLLWVGRRWESGLSAARLLVLVALVLASAFASESLYFVSLNAATRTFWPRNPQWPPVTSAMMSMTFPSIVLFAASLFSILLRVAREEHQRALDVAAGEEKLAEARLDLLQSQLRPHFLFNALNSLTALVRNDPAAARQMIERLESFYLATAAAEDRQSFSLAEELHYVRQYVEIEQVRFGERLAVTIDADPDALGAEVPPLVLQPLVENAIKHGISRMRGRGFVRIRIGIDKGAVTARVENNCDAWRPEAAGLGLTNSRDRLRQFFGGAAALHLAFADGIASAEIVLPAGGRSR